MIDPEGEPATSQPLDKDKLFSKKEWKPSGIAFIGPNTEFERTDPNVLVLDRARYRFSEGSWSEEIR